MHKGSGAGRFRRTVAVVAVLAALCAQGVPQVKAGTADDINQLQQKLNDINKQKDQATNELQRLNAEAAAAQTQQQLVEKEYADAQNQLDAISTQVVSTTNELKQVQADLQQTQQKYDQRKQVFATRIRAIHEEGPVNYIGVLLGSSSFSDFISRFDFLKMIVKQDSQLMDEIRKDKQALETKQQQVANRKTQLEALQAQAKDRANTVAEKRAERETVSRTLDTRIQALRNQLDAYDQETQDVSNQVWQLQQQQNRKRDGAFQPIYPIKGEIIITDPFGPRMHPILHVERMHYGTDFNAPMGTPVYAIESGTVIVSHWDDAYGNLVVIDHGNGYASWYGHASKVLVHEGQTVTQGQQITEAGATGWATGPHVHLEIHVNGTPVDPMTLLP